MPMEKEASLLNKVEFFAEQNVLLSALNPQSCGEFIFWVILGHPQDVISDSGSILANSKSQLEPLKYILSQNHYQKPKILGKVIFLAHSGLNTPHF